MADAKMIPIGEDFDLHNMVNQLLQKYRGKGFEAQATQMGNGVSVTFSKGCSGIKKFLGLGLGITATMTTNNKILMVDFSDAEWMGKIIGFVLGWFLLFVPIFTAGYGAFQQVELPKNIVNDIQMIIGGATPF